MMKLSLLAALAGHAAAFAPAAVGKAPSCLYSDAAEPVEMSVSLPFLRKPKNLEGWVGNVEFDPLGFSDTFDMKWLREAEIKHGRVSMLATVGFVTAQYVKLPMFQSMEFDDSNQAPGLVGAAGMMQIVLVAGFEEYRTNNGNITMDTMFEDPDRVPGDIGFAKARLEGKTEEEINTLQLRAEGKLLCDLGTSAENNVQAAAPT